MPWIRENIPHEFRQTADDGFYIRTIDTRTGKEARKHYNFTPVQEIVQEAERQGMGVNSTQHLLYALCGLMEEVMSGVDSIEIPEAPSFEFDDSGIIGMLQEIAAAVQDNQDLEAMARIQSILEEQLEDKNRYTIADKLQIIIESLEKK